MKHSIWITCLIVGLFNGSQTTWAHEEEAEKHTHPTPHGGQFILQLGENYHGEVVIRRHEMDVYLFDKNMGALSPKGRTGTLTVFVPEKPTKDYSLTPTETYLKADFGLEGLKQFNGNVVVVLDGQSYATHFEWQKHIHGVTDEHWKPSLGKGGHK